MVYGILNKKLHILFIELTTAATTIEKCDHSTSSGSSQDDKVNSTPNEQMEIDDTALNYDFTLKEVISNELNNGMLSFEVKSSVLFQCTLQIQTMLIGIQKSQWTITVMISKVSICSKEHHTFHHMYVAALERQTIQCEHRLQEVQAVEPVIVPSPAKSARSHPHPIFTPM